MLANQLITHNYPTIHPEDQVSFALQLMDDFDIQHIAVIEDDKYLGLTIKDDLLDADEDAPVKACLQDMVRKSVKADEHLFSALRLASQHNLSLVPVISNENEWLGAISCIDLLKAVVTFTSAEEPGAVIVLEMERKSYSFGEISRLVETNDAYITQFNTYPEAETGLLIVTLKVNKIEVSDILATFQRYEYVVRQFFGEEHYENELRNNYENLMAYLKV